jgi:alginate O-acetyltransferase complex protein AlgI
LLTLGVTTLFSYGLAACRKRSIVLLTLGVGLNLLILAFFKYKHLLLPEAIVPEFLRGSRIWAYAYAQGLPIGISFYIFHGISLMVDTYRDASVIDHAGARPTFWRHMLKTTHFISFFPQVVAGPIAKGKHFYTQIGQKYWRDIDWDAAITSMVCGYFLKEVVANNLSQTTQFITMADHTSRMNGHELIWLMVGYSGQIFADFAGYSLVAIGLARLFGYALPRNFNWPYMAASFSEFWQRWHISLSSWLRDYLYIPLGGNRHGAIRLGLNLMIVMGLGGLWHGAEWRYAVWGLLHGALLVGERLLAYGVPERMRNPQQPLARMVLWALRVAVVFSTVTVAWLFFKLPTATEAFHYLAMIHSQWHIPYSGYDLKPMRSLVYGLAWLHLAGILLPRYPFNRAQFAYLKPIILAVMLVMAIAAKGAETPFIYFQF